MGMIQLSMWGSFPVETRTYCAQDHGHADAVASAIEFLSGTLLPWAIRRDHALHTEGEKPTGAFGKDPPPVGPLPPPGQAAKPQERA